ncbi:MAG: serine/threonine protein kinase [Myxococcales bacterium]|nr:serine/threonine protein kinase [Myxococcales bacterium]MBK7195191.1 serine/threonine protein kinase [Myxococcales bacterium]MBP6844528.1 serine/threonine protein kinase [Kofleriaceae bacterium]
MSSVPQRTRPQPVMFGRYRLCGRLAAGGMAEVWAAQLLAPGGFVKPMVIKRVLPELAENPTFLRMLMTEARVAARLSHANVCSVFELGEVTGEYFIAMEYLRGAPLSHVLRDGGAVPPAVAVAMVAQACDGLHYAHEQRDATGNLMGLIHRDVSPHNLFLTVDGVVKVLDFGIAKVDDGISERTEEGKVKGKLTYMSPEQLAAEPIDRRTDVWALGVVLWELLTGNRLFGGGGPADTVDGIRNGRVPRLAERGPVYARLDEAIAGALRVDRVKRFATAAELRRAMLEALAPSAPAGTDELMQLAWERCGNEVGVNDRRFDDDGGPQEDAVVERLPLRAEETEPSVSRAEPVTHTPDTSPEIEVVAPPAAPVAPPVPVVFATPPSRAPWIIVGAVVVAAAALVLWLAPWRHATPPPTAPPPAAVAATVATDAAVPLAPVEPPAAPATAPPVDAAAAPVEPPAAPATAPPAAPTIAVGPAVIEPARRPPRPPAAKPGKLFFDARPWATVYVDGRKLGITPIVGHALPAGPHVIKAVTEDGRAKSVRVDVPAGGEVRKKVTW